MIEILPIRSLTDEDAPIFGSLNVILGKLLRSGFPVGPGLVVTPPQFKLRSVLERFDFGKKEIFRQTLSVVKKEINSIPPPSVLLSETHKHKSFFINGRKINSVKNLWLALLHTWLEQIEQRIWSKGFYPGITDNLDPQVLTFTSKIQGFGTAHFDFLASDVTVLVKEGRLHVNDIKKITEIVKLANKKLLLSYEYEWILDSGVKLIKVKPYTPSITIDSGTTISKDMPCKDTPCKAKRSAVKVFLDLSAPVQSGSFGLNIEKEVDPGSTGVDGIYIASERIFDLNKPVESFEDLVSRVVQSAVNFPSVPVFVKLPDKPEGLSVGKAGMGKLRGSLRLLHQKSLFDPAMKALDFVRHKKGLTNVHIVVPFVRGVNELLKIKRELAVRKLSRKNSLQLWMEVAVPENIINLEDYLIAGIDGVVLNLDELISYLNGFDCQQEELLFYKSEITGLLKFLEDGIRLLHKSKVPFIVYGSLAFSQKVLEFLIEKGVWGMVVECYEAHSAKDLLYQVEKRVILKRGV
ncbi:hypothetical protein KKE78_03765 [Patescibacteria group bacterium]|nr:hypothetical protein [Patescibacteria group bacterium]